VLCVEACYGVLQCVTVCCSVSRCVAACHGVLQCATVCCSVSRCVAVCYSVLQRVVSQRACVCESHPTRVEVMCLAYESVMSRVFFFFLDNLQQIAVRALVGRMSVNESWHTYVYDRRRYECAMS